MFRRIGFKWLETVPDLLDNAWASGYGQQMPTSEVVEVDGLLRENEHYLCLDITRDCNYDVDQIIDQLNLN
jgi:hypothetical protein